MLVDAKYLRVGICLFLCVQGWGREHKVKNIANWQQKLTYALSSNNIVSSPLN